MLKLARREAERIIANRGTPMEVAAAQARRAEVAATASVLDRLKKTLKR